MKHIYLAGSLFSEAEVAQRLKEGAMIRESLGDTHSVFNPIEAPINDKSKLPTCLDIFIGDTKEVLKSDIVIADLSNNDPGVMFELGIAWALDYVSKTLDMPEIDSLEMARVLFEKCGVKNKEVHAVLSDIRVGTANQYSEEEIPFGYNQYVIGGIKHMQGKVHRKFDTVLSELEGNKNV